jgi:hypothetical protein
MLAGCRSVAPPVPLSLVASSSSLALAVRAASRVTDPLQRSAVLATVARGFERGDNVADAQVVADEAVRILAPEAGSLDVIRLRLEIAELLLRIEDTEAARGLIAAATAYAREVRDEQERALLLVRIVEAAIVDPDSTRDLLPAVVDEVYVIEDTRRRAEALIEIAEAYQEVGVGQSVTGLIHQSVPAIRSIPDPNARARFFARVSRRAYAANEMELGDRLVNDAFRELEAAGEDAEPESIRMVAAVVARSGAPERALEFTAGVADPYGRALGYLSVAEELVGQGSVLLLLEEATAEAEFVEDTAEYVAVLAGVAGVYNRVRLSGAALRIADNAASRIFDDAPASGRAELLGQLAPVYVAADRLEALRRNISGLGDAYSRSALSISVARLLAEAGREGFADDFLVDALLEADQAEFLSGGLRRDIAVGFALTGNDSLAVRSVERIEEPLLRAEAVAGVGYHAYWRGDLSDPLRAELEAVLE